MMKSRLILSVVIGVLPLFAVAQQNGSTSDRIKPRWVKKGVPAPANGTYHYQIIEGVATHLGDARNHSVLELIMEMGKNKGIDVSSSRAKNILFSNNTDKELDERNLFHQEVVFEMDQLRLAFKKVDEYWVKRGDEYYCSILYAVAEDPDRKNFPVFSTSSRASAGQVALSVVLPGLGQMLKGNTLKGTLILGGEILFAGGIILAENQRSSYIKKMLEQPKFQKEYSSRANNWENMRNVLIGGAAALYVYNLIDAIAAPAARRIRTKSEKGWKFSPVVYNTVPGGEGVGFGLNYNF